jgi:hypothetical protein
MSGAAINVGVLDFNLDFWQSSAILTIASAVLLWRAGFSDSPTLTSSELKTA